MIEYYIGILPEDRGSFENYISKLNHYNDYRYQVEVLHEFDDPDGYYTFTIRGYWDSYNKLLEQSGNGGFVKSINHYEE